MSKKRIFVIALLVCCLALAATGSLAYFTASETAHNVITSGNIAIELQELMMKQDEEGALVPFESPVNVMPGAELSKIVQVKNTGNSDAWVRVSVDKAIELASDIAGFEPDTALVALDLNTAEWTEKDGFYYYNAALRPGETTVPLFTTVTFAGSGMGNEYQNSTAVISVKADAVQTANNGAAATDAAGWPKA
ncbi:MAG: SipW-dependent-type signal peptide-containing protein [Oscillospiraceae bacterium]|nr:SipW-dependent-type signal peptide-containing protein [Oscillospiraceae bacterium]